MQQSRAITYITGKFIAREQHGIKKYGVTVDRSDLQPEQWLIHLEEELMDGFKWLADNENDVIQKISEVIPDYIKRTGKLRNFIAE